MLRPWVGYLVGAGAVAIVAASCTQDFDELFTGPETVSTTSSGGTTTTSGGGQGGSTGGSGGSTGECTVPEDCSGLATTCRYKTCDNQICGWANAAEGVACTEDPGANVCNGAGTCVECNGPDDCDTEGDICQANECVPPHCTDEEINGGETDLNCGGPDCAPCADGDNCLVYSDCVSLFCNDNSEQCEPCENTGECAGAGDDFWCDPDANGSNGGCVPTEDNGSECTGTEECTSGNCVDGVCCQDTNCPGECNSCAPNGTCALLAANTPCSDGQYCNGAEVCTAGGQCEAPSTPCSTNYSDDDCEGTCNETDDDCSGPEPANSACDDGLYCTTSHACDANGNCVGSGNPCPGEGDGDDCADACNEADDDCTADEADTVACDDGLYCTTTDRCSGGSCVGTGDPCATSIGDCDDNCSESCAEGATSHSCTAQDPVGTPCDKNNSCPQGNHDGTCNAAGDCV
jgi:hypothetical protein